jgi:hypothetical protein
MTTTTIYPIPGYPTVSLTTDGAQMTIRPMVPEDKDALLNFFRHGQRRGVEAGGLFEPYTVQPHHVYGDRSVPRCVIALSIWT